MGTRSTIALEFADGTVEQVYCHWDGYLEHNGEILRENYINPFKLKQLIANGGMSVLKPAIEDCEFYTARGEELNVNRFSTAEEYFQDFQQEEFNYILRNVDGQATWYVEHEGSKGFMLLEQAFAEITAAEAN